MNIDLIPQLVALAKQTPEIEICGLIVDNTLIPSINVSYDPAMSFALDAETVLFIELLKAQNKEYAIYHSHIALSDDDFSANDIRLAKREKIEIVLVNSVSGTIREYNPNTIQPLLAREWRWAYQNCYTLLQDFYQLYFQIKLDDFYLESPNEWEQPGWNKYLENVASQDFELVDRNAELKQGDLIFMWIGRNKNPTHAAIMLDPEENTILQHFSEKLSEISTYDGRYRKLTHSIYRHHQNR